MRARSRQATRGAARVVLALAAVGACLALPGSAGAPPGQLGFDSCVADNVAGCTDLPAPLLGAANGVAVSPDRNSVYVVSGNGTIAHFARANPGGQLTFAGCLARNASNGCTATPHPPIGGATGIAVSPDGTSVYVVTFNGTIAHFAVATPGGQLTFAGCLDDAGQDGCTATPYPPIYNASAVAVSPDGNSVYVVSEEGTIGHFAVTKPGGQLTFAGCLDDNGGGGCTATPYPPILDASAVAVSPDGNSVYVASYTGTIARFAVTRPGGQLTYADCLANTAQGGCLDLPAAPISGASGVAISTDGNSVYVASSASDSVAHFLVSKPGGQLTFGGCLANDDAQACGDLPGTPLDGANDLAISPDDTSLYVVSSISESIAHFFRALGEEPPPGPVTTPGAPPPAASPPAPPGGRRVFCQGKRATIVGTARNDTLRGTAKADVIAALAGDDVVLARGGADLVCGGAGDDTLGGGGGPDRLFGQGGDDTVRGGGGPDLLFGGPGSDGLAGGSQSDVCDGGGAPDQARACETTRQLRSARPATGRRR